MKRFVLSLALLLPSVATAQISCGGGFTSSGACALQSAGGNLYNPSGSNNFATESGGIITFTPASCTHCAMDLWYATKQNIQNFSTSFSFTPNDSAGMGFAIQNVTVCGGCGSGLSFEGGASGELGLSQFDTGGGGNNIFYIKWDRYYGNLTQIYITEQCTSQNTANGCDEVLPQQWQNPLLPLQYSLSPINLANHGPYTANLTYDGYNFCMSLSDSASNSFGPQCWKVNIPAIVGGSTAYVGFGSSTGIASTYATTINTWTFASGTQSTNQTHAGGHTVFAGMMH